MDTFTLLISYIIAGVISFLILHAVVRSAVLQAMQRHTVWLEDRALQPAASGTLATTGEEGEESEQGAGGEDWTLNVRGVSFTVRPLRTNLWSILLDDQLTHTIRRDARGFYPDGSTSRFGTLEEAVQSAARVG